MSSIHQEVVIPASPERVYEALMNAAQFSKFSGGAPSAIVAEDGGSFSCFGGMIHGRNVELVPNQRIVQAWRAKPWESGLYSIARFELLEDGTGTRVILHHTGFPTEQEQHLERGWHSNYWEPLQKYLA